MKTWKRRWFILTDNCLYYFEYTTVSEAAPSIVLESRLSGLASHDSIVLESHWSGLASRVSLVGQGAQGDHPPGEPEHQGGGGPSEAGTPFPRAPVLPPTLDPCSTDSHASGTPVTAPFSLPELL